VHWKLLPTGSTVTAEYYCEQLDRVANELRGKQDKVYFLHDNARPHIANTTHQKLLDLGWTVLPHPPYSPDLAPTDYHLFRSLAAFLDKNKFDDEDHLKQELENFFKQKSTEFDGEGISSLPVRWKKVIDSNGAYIV
jgi:histone-lysine N-methyltransferase SETMAR